MYSSLLSSPRPASPAYSQPGQTEKPTGMSSRHKARCEVPQHSERTPHLLPQNGAGDTPGLCEAATATLHSEPCSYPLPSSPPSPPSPRRRSLKNTWRLTWTERGTLKVRFQQCSRQLRCCEGKEMPQQAQLASGGPRWPRHRCWLQPLSWHSPAVDTTAPKTLPWRFFVALIYFHQKIKNKKKIPEHFTVVSHKWQVRCILSKSSFIVNLISINALFASFATAMLYRKATSNGSSEKRANTLPTWKRQQGLDSLPPLSSPPKLIGIKNSLLTFCNKYVDSIK